MGGDRSFLAVGGSCDFGRDSQNNILHPRRHLRVHKRFLAVVRVFPIRARRTADLNIVDWKAINVFISTRGALRSLIQVLMVFERVAHPEVIRRLMPLTAMMGLLTVAARRPQMYH